MYFRVSCSSSWRLTRRRKTEAKRVFLRVELRLLSGQIFDELVALDQIHDDVIGILRFHHFVQLDDVRVRHALHHRRFSPQIGAQVVPLEHFAFVDHFHRDLGATERRFPHIRLSSYFHLGDQMNAETNFGETSFADRAQNDVVADFLPFFVGGRFGGGHGRSFVVDAAGRTLSEIFNHTDEKKNQKTLAKIEIETEFCATTFAFVDAVLFLLLLAQREKEIQLKKQKKK